MEGEPAPKKKNLQVEPGAGPSSLFILSDTNPIRRATKFLIEWPPFEYTVLLTIIANCVVLAIEEPQPNRDKTELARKLEATEQYFLGIFTVEASLKILALGFILHRGSYLRNMWNIMDFVVVVTGYITLLTPEDENIKPKEEESVDLRTLRAIRVLRPLKLVSGVPSLQVVLKSIFKALAPLMQIGLLVSFAILIFAIIGLEFYSGALHKTCYSIEDLDEIVPDGSRMIVPCNAEPPEIAPPGSYQCNASSAICLEKWQGPNYGITSFDNILYAMLTVFQCITMEGWTTLLYWFNDALGNQFSFIYFVPLIVIGSFFMLNLVLGVLSGEFSNERTRVERRETFRKLRMRENFSRAFEGYFQWISKAEEAILNEERTTEEERRYILEARKRALAKKKKLRTLGRRARSRDSDEDQEEEDELLKDDKDKDKKRAATQAAFKRKFKKNSDFWVYEKKIRLVVRKAIKQQWFYWSVIILVFLNTMCVAVEHYNQPEWLSQFLHLAEYIFLCFFICETVVRMWALGPSIYFEASFNRFDCLVISGSVFEVLWTHFKPKAGSFGLSVLRALRLLRIFKVTVYWSSLRNLVVSLLASMKSIISLLLLLFLFILIFALLGMQLFGGTFNFESGTPATNFDSFAIAMLTVFQILTGEDWNEVMYLGIQSQGGAQAGLIYSLYFIFLTMFGNYTLLNVFLAIAVDSLGQAQEMTAIEEKEKERAEKEVVDERAKFGPVPVSEKAKDEAAQKAAALAAERAAAAALEEAQLAGLPPPVLPYSSLFIFSSENSFRCGIHSIVTFPLFDVFIMLVIVASSISLASEDPVNVDSDWNKFLGQMDYGFTCIFAIEVFLKILDYGLVLHPGSYLREMWNCMDLVVVSCAITSFTMDMIGSSGAENLGVIKSFRVIRVLRPLKTIKRVPKLKAVFDCVINSLKNVFNILIVYLLFHFIFAVIAVQLFNGKFFFCNDASMEDADTCQGEFFVFGEALEPPSVFPRVWRRQKFHYDNVPVACLTLFAVQTTEGWPVVLQQSMAVTYEDQGPIPIYRIEMSIFYIVYFIVFPFFFVNIFVALIIITFQEQGEAELQEAEIDKNQKSCIDFAINARPLERYMPEERDSYKYKLWRLVESTPFEYFIMTLIVLNTILLMLKFHGAPLILVDILSYMNLTFTFCFSIECILKLIAFGPGSYFKDNWNIFDFITVVGSIVDALMVEFAKNFINVGFLRLFRAARLVKLLRQGYTIRILLWTFIQSFKALPYVILLIAMLFFIYAIIGMQVFGNIDFDPDTEYNRHVHFQTFIQGLMVLFRCATGEAWPMIMLACEAGRPCALGAIKRNQTTGELLEPGKSCGSNITFPFFVTFVFLCSFLMLNLFVAVIMDNFDYLTRDSSILGAHHLDEFIRIWAEYDPSAEGRIYYSEMYDMLKNMDPPLGFGSKCPDRLAFKKLIRMNQPIDEDGTVHFTTTLFALIRENLSIKMRSAGEMDQADAELRATICKVWPYEGKDKVDLLVPPQDEIGKGKLTVGKIYGGLLILENWKTTKFGKLVSSDRPKGSLLQQIMGLTSAGLNGTKDTDSNLNNHHKAMMNGGPRMDLKLTPQLPSTTPRPTQLGRESPLSSYGESFQADSPDPKDYFGRWDSRSPSPTYNYYNRRQHHRSPPKRGAGYNEYINYDYERNNPRHEKRRRARDSGFYGGGHSREERESVRRKEREDRDNMVRDFIRNGKGWSQPNSNSGERSRKLPRTPANSLNAMGVLQSMLGLNPTPLGSMNTINGSAPSVVVNQTLDMAGNMVNAVRRLPQVPGPGAPAQQGIFSKLFGKKEATTPMMSQTAHQLLNQQNIGMNQPTMGINQPNIGINQQNIGLNTLNMGLSQPLNAQNMGLNPQNLGINHPNLQPLNSSSLNQQQQILNSQQMLGQQQMNSVMYGQQQQQLGDPAMLQQQLLMQQNMLGGSVSSIPGLLPNSGTLPNLNLPSGHQSGLHPSHHQLAHPSHPGHPGSHQPIHPGSHQPLHPGSHQPIHPGSHQPIHQPIHPSNHQPTLPETLSYPSTGLPQFCSGLHPSTQSQQQSKKPGEGWGGRGARLPKIPIPLPTKNPRKAHTLVGGPFSRSLEEVEEDLFLERVVTVGRGSRRLPTPGGTLRSRKRLTRQSSLGETFRRGYSLDSDEFEVESRDSNWP